MSKSSVLEDGIQLPYKPQSVCVAEYSSTYLRHKKGGPNGGLKNYNLYLLHKFNNL